MIAGLFPAAGGAEDAAAVGRVDYVGRGPDVVKAAAFVGGVPVGRAKGPPTVGQPLGNVLAGHVVPASGLHHGSHMLDLDRRVRDDLQQLLVVANVVDRAEAVRQDGMEGTIGEMRDLLLPILKAYEVADGAELAGKKLGQFLTARCGSVSEGKSKLGDPKLPLPNFAESARSRPHVARRTECA